MFGGAPPKTFKYSEEMLADKELDAVMVATGDHQHARLLAEVVKAGKDCCCEKPMANTLEDAKLARDRKGRQTSGADGVPMAELPVSTPGALDHPQRQVGQDRHHRSKLELESRAMKLVGARFRRHRHCGAAGHALLGVE